MNIIKRIAASLAILMPLGVYLFGIQLIYDKTIAEQQPMLKAGLYLVALILGSATYDFSKTALFMPKRHFSNFFSGLFGAWLAFICIIIFATISALILNNPYLVAKIPSWLGYLMYLAALCCIPWFILDLSKAIESATK